MTYAPFFVTVLSQPRKTTLTQLGLVVHAINTQSLTDCIGFAKSYIPPTHPLLELAFMGFTFSHPSQGVDFKGKLPKLLTLLENQLLKQRRKKPQ